MFDYLRNLTKSAEEQRQEMLTAYVDGELSPREAQQFEAMMAQDNALRAEVAQQQLLQQRLQAAPRRRVPRNFTLDPAAYGAPEPQPLFRLYPVLQTATVLAALMLFFVLGLDFFSASQLDSAASSEPVAQIQATAVASETVEVEVTRVIEAELTADDAQATEEEEPAAVEAADEAPKTTDQEQLHSFAAPESEPLPTPTQSSLPREQVEPTLEARSGDPAVLSEALEAETSAEDEFFADEALEEEELLEETAVLAEEAAVPLDQPTASPWLSWQIGLALLFIILLVVTLIVRQRIQ